MPTLVFRSYLTQPTPTHFNGDKLWQILGRALKTKSTYVVHKQHVPNYFWFGLIILSAIWVGYARISKIPKPETGSSIVSWKTECEIYEKLGKCCLPVIIFARAQWRWAHFSREVELELAHLRRARDSFEGWRLIGTKHLLLVLLQLCSAQPTFLAASVFALHPCQVTPCVSNQHESLWRSSHSDLNKVLPDTGIPAGDQRHCNGSRGGCF